MEILDELLCFLNGGCIKAGDGPRVKLLVEPDNAEIHSGRQLRGIATTIASVVSTAFISTIVWVVRVIWLCTSNNASHRHR